VIGERVKSRAWCSLRSDSHLGEGKGRGISTLADMVFEISD